MKEKQIISKQEFDKENIFGLGNPNDGFAKYFSNSLTIHLQYKVFLNHNLT